MALLFQENKFGGLIYLTVDLLSMSTVMVTEENTLELTERLLSIVEMCSNGYSAKPIGIKLKMSNRTVEAHIGNLRRFFKAKSIPHLVAIFFRRGLIK